MAVLLQIILYNKHIPRTSLSKDILPLSEFRANAPSIIASLKEEPDKAIVVTQNGRPAAVVLSVAEYEEMRLSFLDCRQLAEGLMGLRKGKSSLADLQEALERLHQDEARQIRLQKAAE